VRKNREGERETTGGHRMIHCVLLRFRHTKQECVPCTMNDTKTADTSHASSNDVLGRQTLTSHLSFTIFRTV
jgi:hypothetical protein